MNKHHENGGARSIRTAAKRFSRVFLPICLIALLIMISIGSTLAFLTDQTASVVNTFTVGDIDITLKESPYSYEGGKDVYATPAEKVVTNSYPMIPGKTYTKDPVVTVVGDAKNVDVYLFIECTENMASGLLYELNLEGWEELTGENGVYYREVKASTKDQSWNLIKDNKVTVSADLVREDTMPKTNSTLTFKAYAIQTESFSDAAAAWDEVSKLN